MKETTYYKIIITLVISSVFVIGTDFYLILNTENSKKSISEEPVVKMTKEQALKAVFN
jgi:hypothetical protein